MNPKTVVRIHPRQPNKTMEVILLTKANVGFKILSVTEVTEGSWRITFDLNIRTENDLFCDEKGTLLGYLPAGEDPISLDRVLKLCAQDRKEEIIKAIEEEKKKRV